YEVPGNGTYKVVATDALGNESVEKSITVEKLDKANPEISVSDSPTELKREHTYTITTSDALSGVKEIAVNGAKIDGNIYTVTADGEYKFVVTDNAGNTAEQIVNVNFIDTEAPVLTVGEESEYAKVIDLPVSVTDNKSSDITITVNSEPFNGSAYTITENGTYVFKAVDEAGNEATVTRVVTKIDRDGPIVTLNEAPTEWTNSFTLSINAVDSGAGVAAIKVNGVLLGGTTYEVPENGIYKVVATDALGNESVEKSITVEKLDKANPEMVITDAPVAWTREHTFEITASDALSGIKEITVNGTKLEGLTYTVTANGEYKFVVTDNAGNVFEKTVNVTKIDELAPVFGGELASKEILIDSIKVALPTATDDSGEAVTYELYLNGTKVEGFAGESEYTFTGLTVATSYTVKLIATDTVGRTTEITAVYTTVDLGRIEATVDLSGFTASADKLHMSMVVNGVTLPVDSDGKVVFEGLTEGTYTATFKAAGFFDVAKAELVVKNGEVTTINITKAELVAGDTTADGVINIYDLNAVASAFAESYDGETGLIYDFNRDGKVDANDIKILVANYNKAKAQ
ncbi:MAG: hypothetical protein IJN39_05915, partial [Clostridia bacterium]|nr:hypothetical protein [Clostridia bacterium]